MTISASIKVGPQDARCKYIAKLVRAGQGLPTPTTVSDLGMRALGGNLARNGLEELFPGDFLFESEEMHHRRERGYRTRVVFVADDGELIHLEPTAEHKAAMKAAGLAPDLLAGAGPLAACVRVAHAVRLGIEWGRGL